MRVSGVREAQVPSSSRDDILYGRVELLLACNFSLSSTASNSSSELTTFGRDDSGWLFGSMILTVVV